MSKEARRMLMYYLWSIRTKYVPYLSELLEQLVEKFPEHEILKRTIATTHIEAGIHYEIGSSRLRIGYGSSGAYYFRPISPLDLVKKVVYGYSTYEHSNFPDLRAANSLTVEIEFLSRRFGIKLTGKKQRTSS